MEGNVHLLAHFSIEGFTPCDRRNCRTLREKRPHGQECGFVGGEISENNLHEKMKPKKIYAVLCDELPDCCFDCFLINDTLGGYFCHINGCHIPKKNEYKGRPWWCRLKVKAE
jgi:hypothetical protein